MKHKGLEFVSECEYPKVHGRITQQLLVYFKPKEIFKGFGLKIVFYSITVSVLSLRGTKYTKRRKGEREERGGRDMGKYNGREGGREGGGEPNLLHKNVPNAAYPCKQAHLAKLSTKASSSVLSADWLEHCGRFHMIFWAKSAEVSICFN